MIGERESFNPTRRPLSGGPPLTIPYKGAGAHGYGSNPAHFPYRYPLRAALSARQREVLELIRIRPRSLRELAEAMNVGEWSIVCQAADQLVNRGLAEIVPDAAVRPTWRHVKGATEGNPPEA